MILGWTPRFARFGRFVACGLGLVICIGFYAGFWRCVFRDVLATFVLSLSYLQTWWLVGAMFSCFGFAVVVGLWVGFIVVVGGFARLCG